MSKIQTLILELKENGYNEEDAFREPYFGADGDFRFKNDYSIFQKGEVLEALAGEATMYSHPEEHY